MRLIDADELRFTISKLKYPEARINMVLAECVNTAPTVDPIQHGKWIAQNGYCECSECHYYSNMYTKHCPNCGADMRESEERE